LIVIQDWMQNTINLEQYGAILDTVIENAPTDATTRTKLWSTRQFLRETKRRMAPPDIVLRQMVKNNHKKPFYAA
jgi:hypothetical protein